MYTVAHVDTKVCGDTKCRQCTMFCPEPNTIMYDDDKNTAYVVETRCKGCTLCVFICDTTIKAHAIAMDIPTLERLANEAFEASEAAK